MKKNIADRWIAQLRNGEIKQWVGSLGVSNGARCCLGVLCDIAIKDGIIDPPTLIPDTDDTDDVPYTLEYGQYVGQLPSAVQKWAGMHSTDGSFRLNTEGNTSLTTLNDHGMTFAEIADLIETFQEQL
jgi:hypothetical protein